MTLEAVHRIVEEGGDADDVLRGVVEALATDPDVDWAAIRFIEEGELVLGPASGEPDEGRRSVTSIRYRGEQVGELLVDGAADEAALTRVADVISEYVLLGWDTGGQTWEP